MKRTTKKSSSKKTAKRKAIKKVVRKKTAKRKRNPGLKLGKWYAAVKITKDHPELGRLGHPIYFKIDDIYRDDDIKDGFVTSESEILEPKNLVEVKGPFDYEYQAKSAYLDFWKNG